MPIEELTPTRRPVPDNLFGGSLRDAFLLDLEVIRVEHIAAHVRSITVASTDLLGFHFKAGQDLTIEFPDGSRTVRRRYTIRRPTPQQAPRIWNSRSTAVAVWPPDGQWTPKSVVASKPSDLGGRSPSSLSPGLISSWQTTPPCRRLLRCSSLCHEVRRQQRSSSPRTVPAPPRTAQLRGYPAPVDRGS